MKACRPHNKATSLGIVLLYHLQSADCERLACLPQKRHYVTISSCATGWGYTSKPSINQSSAERLRRAQVRDAPGAVLLVLDNAEDVATADALAKLTEFLQNMLAAAPELRVLLTSRRAMPLEGAPRFHQAHVASDI